MTFNSIYQQISGQKISLPTTWFEARITLEQIRESFSTGRVDQQYPLLLKGAYLLTC